MCWIKSDLKTVHFSTRIILNDFLKRSEKFALVKGNFIRKLPIFIPLRSITIDVICLSDLGMFSTDGIISNKEYPIMKEIQKKIKKP